MQLKVPICMEGMRQSNVQDNIVIGHIHTQRKGVLLKWNKEEQIPIHTQGSHRIEGELLSPDKNWILDQIMATRIIEEQNAPRISTKKMS